MYNEYLSCQERVEGEEGEEGECNGKKRYYLQKKVITIIILLDVGKYA